MSESKLDNSKSGKRFCSRKCKDFAQSLEGGCKEIQPSHYGTRDRMTRAYCKHRPKLIQENNCIGCGESKKYLLCLHHKDSNPDNNVHENLEVVCFNCHAKRHLRYCGKIGDWIFSTKFLTDRSILHSL